MIPKNKPIRSKRWLQNVGELQQCVMCGAWGVQVAHRNEGKAMGRKTSDILTAALCEPCHSRCDNGKDMTKEERRAFMNEAIIRTLEALSRAGKVKAA